MRPPNIHDISVYLVQRIKDDSILYAFFNEEAAKAYHRLLSGNKKHFKITKVEVHPQEDERLVIGKAGGNIAYNDTVVYDRVDKKIYSKTKSTKYAKETRGY